MKDTIVIILPPKTNFIRFIIRLLISFEYTMYGAQQFQYLNLLV